METRKEDLAFISSKNNPAILGTLTGPCADIIHPTRNERLYSDKLWENVFNNEIVKEYFEAGGVFGELGLITTRFSSTTTGTPHLLSSCIIADARSLSFHLRRLVPINSAPKQRAAAEKRTGPRSGQSDISRVQ